MPHQCVHCGEFYPAGSKELLTGCNKCNSRFFFYIRDDQVKKIKENPLEVSPKEKKKIEKDIRDIAGIIEEDVPVVLDIESIRVTGEGKFEIDLVKLFKKKTPLIYKIEEGRYVIDLTSTFKKELEKNEED